MTKQQDETCYLKSDFLSIPNIRRFSHEAMATTFEVVIVHEDGRYAQQAAIAAFKELDRLETELSRFIENSDISRINNLPANQPLTIGLAAFECLQLSARIYNETNGAFDVTIGPLLKYWLNKDKNPERFSENQLNLARQRTGMHLIKLDETGHTVQLLTSPVQIDLGGIGKGYAVDRMAELLREWSIDIALICGGYSSILALDAPDNTKGWPVTLSNPPRRFASPAASSCDESRRGMQTRSSGGKQTLAYLYLQNRAVGASGLQKGRHIIDPRTGRPVQGKIATWACVSDAATADALSTAFMVMSPDEIEQYCSSHPQVQALVILQEEDKKALGLAERRAQREKILRFGRWKKHELLK